MTIKQRVWNILEEAGRPMTRGEIIKVIGDLEPKRVTDALYRLLLSGHVAVNERKSHRHYTAAKTRPRDMRGHAPASMVNIKKARAALNKKVEEPPKPWPYPADMSLGALFDFSRVARNVDSRLDMRAQSRPEESEAA